MVLIRETKSGQKLWGIFQTILPFLESNVGHPTAFPEPFTWKQLSHSLDTTKILIDFLCDTKTERIQNTENEGFPICNDLHPLKVWP